MDTSPFYLQNNFKCNSSALTKLLLSDFANSNYRPIKLNLTPYTNKLDILIANISWVSTRGINISFSVKRLVDYDSVTMRLMNWLDNEGYIVKHIAKQNRINKPSHMTVTSKLALAIAKHKIKARLKKGISETFITKADKTVRVKTPLMISKPIDAYNKTWLDNDATLHGQYLVPFAKRIFKYSTKLGGRYYWSGITIRKEERANILINGEPTLELDYKSIHFNLLYASIEKELTEDPYDVQGIDRKSLKTAMLSFINIENRSSWERNVTLSGNQDNKNCIGFIDGLPSNIIGKELSANIDKRHSDIKHLFHTKNIGLSLQYKDSEILSEVIKECSKLDIALLPYHDGVRLPESQMLTVKTIMEDAYRKKTGFNIGVELQ